ncbi:MAG TPA: polysaccharide biosynthesis tyrosine autokinase, partial [Proteobacteria bacterium]|nr:polysaccharide biosynthesis tyrosine autokinase [Pseudomonadota bacterium]
RLAELSSALTEAKRKRLEAEGRYKEVKRILKNPELAEAFPGVVDNDLIQKLKAQLIDVEAELAQISQRYKPEHPQRKRVEARLKALRDRLSEEINKILRSFELEYKVALERERSIQSALDEIEEQALSLGRKLIEFEQLKNEVDSLRQVFAALKTRAREAEVSGNIAANNITIIDAADVPLNPVRPRKRLNVALAILVGLVGGVGLAFLQEYLDNTVKVQEDVETLVGLPFLGAVPSYREEAEAGEEASMLFALGHPRSSFAESCRVVRTNLIFALANRERRRVLVTSPGPQEGKTTIAANLAVILAQGGSRVLLVDSDLRRPLIGELFGFGRDTKGLTDLILGRVSVDEAIKSTEVEGLFVVPSGPIPPNPSELLGSPRFRELVELFSERFDWAIFDSPPVVAVADSVVLSSLVDGVVLVVKSAKTTRDLLKRAYKQLSDVNAPLLGTVLNDYDVRTEGYRYYYYYRYYRGEGSPSEGEEGKGRGSLKS